MQIVPADAHLRRKWSGKPIGYRVLDIDRSVYQPFTRERVEETTIPGSYVAIGGVSVPDAGGHIVWGTESEDIAEASVDPAPAQPPSNDVIVLSIDTLSARLHELAERVAALDKSDQQQRDIDDALAALDKFLAVLEKTELDGERILAAHKVFSRVLNGE